MIFSLLESTVQDIIVFAYLFDLQLQFLYLKLLVFLKSQHLFMFVLLQFLSEVVELTLNVIF